MLGMDLIELLGYGIITVVTLGLMYIVNLLFRKPEEGQVSIFSQEVKPNGTTTSTSSSTGKKNKGNKAVVDKDKGGKGKNKPRSRTTSEVEAAIEIHPWSVAIFRGHSAVITDMNWSSNDKFIASCAQDRTVMIWFAKDLLTKDRRSIRVNMPFDNARLICWSPDCTAFIVAREELRVLEVFKMGKKAEGSHVTVNPLMRFKQVHDEDIVGIGIACTGLYIMSCSTDGNLFFWDVKGTILERTHAPVGTATCAKVSTCGRYVAVCGNDCLMMEVNFNEMKEFQSVRLFGKLKSHESRVEDVDFNADSTRIVTVTENGVWRLFDTTGNRINVVCMGQANLHIAGCLPTVSLSTDGRIVAVGHTNQIDIFEVTLGSSTSSIEPSWTIPSEFVTKIVFSADGKYILAAGDKTIRVFHNVCGYFATIRDLSQQISESSTNSSLKNRLIAEINTIFVDLPKLDLGDKFLEDLQEAVQEYLAKTALPNK